MTKGYSLGNAGLEIIAEAAQQKHFPSCLSKSANVFLRNGVLSDCRTESKRQHLRTGLWSRSFTVLCLSGQCYYIKSARALGCKENKIKSVTARDQFSLAAIAITITKIFSL